MSGLRSWLVVVVLWLGLFGACSAMAGGVDHWPSSLCAAAVMLAGKAANDRLRVLKWPMEFVFWSAILFVTSTLVLLHFKEL